MIRHYTFNYDMDEAEACFKVDTDKFTAEIAQETLDFFVWDYDKDADPIDEVMKKYALECIRVATFNSYNLFGVKHHFESNEGFCHIDGSQGIELNLISGFEFDDDRLDMTVVTD